MIKFDILNWFTGKVQFTAEIDCSEDACRSVKIGLAVRWALKSGTDLSGANLMSANLMSANLRSANLRSANLRSANLSGANLMSANLSGADLMSADLSGANLMSANLSGANLLSANLMSATLSGANLMSANLSGANLMSADLMSANLSGANLMSADLSGADLRSATGSELAVARTRILPDGALIGWKKCAGDVIVKLRIPADAPRSHAFGRKCRAGFARVLEVHGAKVGISLHDNKTKYIKGKTVTAHQFDPDWMQECSGGIHFYITRAEAEGHR